MRVYNDPDRGLHLHTDDLLSIFCELSSERQDRNGQVNLTIMAIIDMLKAFKANANKRKGLWLTTQHLVVK